MRSNAPITALLALAALSFLPVSSLAKTTHPHASKTAGAKTSKVSAKIDARHEAHKKPRAESIHNVYNIHDTRSNRRHASAKPTVSRVHETSRRREPRGRELRVREQIPARNNHDRHHRQTREAANQPTRVARAKAPALTQQQKASSADFLRAATASSVQPATEIHGTSHPSEPSGASTAHQQTPASTSTSVVSVIRPTADRPQLKSVEETASTPVILPTLYNKRGRLIVPAALKGSHEILIHQNLMADHDGLGRIQNDEDLLLMRNQRLLVALPVSESLDVDERLPANRRFARPWTAQFLATLARAHYAHFHSPLQVNSAVRTVEFQQHLMHINGNAAPFEGDTASPHLTGQAIDIAKHGLSLTEIAWMRGYLLPLVQEGKIDVEEEFQQSCFHISVYRRYIPSANIPQRNISTTSRYDESSALATAVR
jgi:hypothetical protein